MRNQDKHIPAFRKHPWIACLILWVMVFFALPAAAQNTKGDKPVSNQVPTFFKIPKAKNKTKRGDRAYTRDISGRKRIRTKDKSSANHIVYQAPNPYKERSNRKHGDVAGQPRGRIYNQSPRGKEKAYTGTRDGQRLRVRSISGQASRSNVYPNTGKYVNRRSTYSQKHKVYTRTARGKRIYKSKPPSERASAGGANYGSASGNYIKRGRKNVYWGKFSKGERPVTTDLTGRKLRTKNFHSAGIAGGNADSLNHVSRKPHRDQANSGQYNGGYVSASGLGEKPWLKDVSGHKIRRRPPRNGEAGGLIFQAPFNPSPGHGDQVGKRLHGGGYQTYKKKGLSNSPLPPRAPGIGAGGIAQSLKRLTGSKRKKGGGSVSGQFFNNNGQPIQGKSPGIGAAGIGNFKGNLYQQDVSPGFSHEGGNYKGNLKRRRSPKGGGSISGQLLNNHGRPVDVRAPGIGSQGIGNFQGKLRRSDLTGISREGSSYSGNLKRKRPLKGGGSVSGKHWNNGGQPLQPQFGAAGFERPAHFQGNFRKGDLSPEMEIGGYGYKGNIKAKKPKHGGGSISGRPMNNGGEPIDVRTGSDEAKAVGYSGKTRLPLSPWNYIQNPHAHKNSLKKRKPHENTYLAEGLQLRIPQKKYTKKPHAADDALKGIVPGEGTVRASEYDHVLKQTWSYKHNPSAKKGGLNVIAPNKYYSRMNEFQGHDKQGSYVRNPSSYSGALKVIAPGKAFARINDYQGNTKMKKYNDSRLHPDAQFAHSYRNNVKDERSFMMNVKLFWAKLFKKNDGQPAIVKEKERKPRYDKKEQDLWKVLYD